MAQSAVAAIRTGCNMLSEGKAEIDKFKKTVEKGVGDAKAIYNEVVGIWGWIQGIFGAKPTSSVKPVLPTKQLDDINVADTTKSSKQRQQEKELTYEEFQALQVHEICENLKTYFEALRQLKAHCHELEVQSLESERIADSAIDRIEIEWQLKQLSGQLKQVMVWGTPESLGLGAMYKEFLVKYDEIIEAQRIDREMRARKERNAAWRRELLRNHRVDRGITAVTVVVLILWMWGMMLSYRWLVKIPNGSLLESLF